MDSKELLIVGEIQNALSRLLGTSAAAVMRTAGTAACYKIWPNLPSGKTFEEAGELMTKEIAKIGGFGDFAVTGVEDGVAKIAFKQCYFAGMTKESGKPCGEQPICYFGFGLVEETLKRLTGIKTKVALVTRDDGTETCFETATPR